VSAAGRIDGLTSEQAANARTIVAVGRDLNVPSYGWVIAVATAMQESSLINTPGGDRDSVGLFQQRASWGSAGDRMDPAIPARMFYTGGQQGQPGVVGHRGLPAEGVDRRRPSGPAQRVPERVRQVAAAGDAGGG
jgi:hypothetical protein